MAAWAEETGAAPSAPAPCKTIIDTFNGKEIAVIDRSDVRKLKGLVRLKDVAGKDKDAVLIGFTAEDESFLGGAGHAYLMVGSTRYDGNLLFQPAHKREDTNTVSDGLFIKFPDMKPEDVELLRKQINASSHWQHRSLSCVPGVCNQLRRGPGIKGGGYQIFASAIFKSLMMDGFTDAEGHPVKMEIYRTNEHPIEYYYQGLQTKRRVALKALAVMAGGAGLLGGAGYGIYAWIADDDDDRDHDKDRMQNAVSGSQ